MALNGFKDLSCRLCLSKEKLQVSIFSEYGIENNIAKKISICLPVDISVVEKDEFSKTICNKCLCKLNMNYNFFLQTLKISRRFKNNGNSSNEQELFDPDTPATTTTTPTFEFPKQKVVNNPSEIYKTTQMENSCVQVDAATQFENLDISIPMEDDIESQLDEILEKSSQRSEIVQTPVFDDEPIVKSKQLEKDKFGQLIVWSQTNKESFSQINENVGNDFANEIPSSQVSTKKHCVHKPCHRRKRHSKNCTKNKKPTLEPDSDREPFDMGEIDISPDLFSSSTSDFYGF